MDFLIVVDMQNDFIDCALGTKEAQAIVPKVAEKIKNFDGKVFYTRDTHDEKYLETQEGKNLLRGTVLIHHLRKHIVGNSDKKYDPRLVCQAVLVQTVFVDQAEITFLKDYIFIQYPLVKFSFHNIGKFQIIMRVKLRIFPFRIGIMIAEILRRRHHRCIQVTGRIEVPA